MNLGVKDVSNNGWRFEPSQNFSTCQEDRDMSDAAEAVTWYVRQWASFDGLNKHTEARPVPRLEPISLPSTARQSCIVLPFVRPSTLATTPKHQHHNPPPPPRTASPSASPI